MSLKTTIFLLILAIGVVYVAAREIPVSNSAVITGRQSRFSNFFLDYLRVSPRCKECPNRYCDTDPGIILGYCCGCRRALDILPVHCSPAIICPPYLRDVCHDYEYMLHCCC